ncbi:hypothetical protein R1flu_013067 [Riccia fluitans]|uniref:Uncharacterized protein n=1 Tax=Riccia fluitans TaxID=41844 RepID=A0ABD1ZCE0_9MARC
MKIPHLTIADKKKMETWGLGDLFAVDWSGTYEDLVEELAGHQKAAVPKYEYRGKPRAWTSDVWKKVYNLSKASPGGYVMKGSCSECHFHEMDVEEKRDSKKRKDLIHTVFDSNTKIEDEKEPKEDVPRTIYEGEAGGSKPLDRKTIVDYDKWGICLESLVRETSKLFEAFHVEVGSVTAEAMANNMKEIFAAPPVAEVDI